MHNGARCCGAKVQQDVSGHAIPESKVGSLKQRSCTTSKTYVIQWQEWEFMPNRYKSSFSLFLQLLLSHCGLLCTFIIPRCAGKFWALHSSKSGREEQCNGVGNLPQYQHPKSILQCCACQVGNNQTWTTSVFERSHFFHRNSHHSSTSSSIKPVSVHTSNQIWLCKKRTLD